MSMWKHCWRPPERIFRTTWSVLVLPCISPPLNSCARFYSMRSAAHCLLTLLRQPFSIRQVPSSVRVLSRMPLLPNGKLNRKALPHHDIELGDVAEYVAPTSRIETVIQAAWEVCICL